MHFLFINAATVYSSSLVRTVLSVNMARQPNHSYDPYVPFYVFQWQ